MLVQVILSAGVAFLIDVVVDMSGLAVVNNDLAAVQVDLQTIGADGIVGAGDKAAGSTVGVLGHDGDIVLNVDLAVRTIDVLGGDLRGLIFAVIAVGIPQIHCHRSS